MYIKCITGFAEGFVANVYFQEHDEYDTALNELYLLPIFHKSYYIRFLKD